jgi:hypothetical protein
MIWDLKSGNCSRIIRTKHTGGILGLQASGKVIITAGSDKIATKFTFDFEN